MDTSTLTPEEDRRAREEHVRKLLSQFKTVADLAANPQNRGTVVQRLGSVAIAKHVQALEHEQELAKAAAAAARDNELEALTVAAHIEDKLGPDWITYEPETILEETKISAEDLVKVLCVRHVLYDVSPFTDWHVFEKMAVILNGRTPDFETTQDLSPAELAWAAHHMRYIDPVTPFSEEVKNYIATFLRDAGCVVCPDSLGDCQPNLDRITSDYGHECKHEYVEPKAEHTEALQHQLQLKEVCENYVAHKQNKLMKELAAL